MYQMFAITVELLTAVFKMTGTCRRSGGSNFMTAVFVMTGTCRREVLATFP
jgi:hypothetical protein